MAVLNVSMDVNQIVDVSLPGVPVPNTGVFLVGQPNISAPTVIQLFSSTTNALQLKAIAAGSCSVFVRGQNAVGTQFPVDQIDITVNHPTPPATGSGITVSAPHN